MLFIESINWSKFDVQEKCPNCNCCVSKEVKCPKCKGIGQLPDNGNHKICSMCSGTANATCPTCGGSG